MVTLRRNREELGNFLRGALTRVGAWVASDPQAALMAALFALLAAIPALFFPDSAFNGQLVVAKRMFHGYITLPESISYIEHFTRNGEHFLAYGVMQSLVLTPFVALSLGLATQVGINAFLIASTALLIFLMLRSHRELAPGAIWGALAYSLGTLVIYSWTDGNGWLLMHSEGNFLLSLALYLAWARGRFGWAGFCFALAANCRYSLHLAAIAFVGLAWIQSGGRWRPLMKLGATFALGVLGPEVVALAINQRVTGNWLVSPYAYTFENWHLRSLFGFEFVWANLKTYFATPPVFIPEFPYVRFPLGGTSMIFMSPFILASAAGSWRIREIRPLLLTTVTLIVFHLFFYWSGYSQYQTRYWTDLLPFLVPAAVAGFTPIDGRRRTALVALVGLSIGLNLFGAWVKIHHP